MIDENNPQAFFKKQMAEQANEQIQATLASLREDVERFQREKADLEAKATAAVSCETRANPEGERLKNPTPVASSTPPVSVKINRLVYFSYPVFGYGQPPAWVGPLKEALVGMGYLVYSPGEQVGQQFGKPDISALNSIDKKLNKQTCGLLSLPEELLLAYEHVAEIIQAGDHGDRYGAYFKHLWFLTRSSLVISDITKPDFGGEIGQELLLAKQLNIPTLGVMPESGHVSPWLQKSITAFLAAEFNLHNIVPLIRGYAPL